MVLPRTAEPAPPADGGPPHAGAVPHRHGGAVRRLEPLHFTKALQHARDPRTLGIVVFGVRYESTAANVILGAVMGIVLGPTRTASGI